jgi:outer membrane biosynthesis protein TonB
VPEIRTLARPVVAALALFLVVAAALFLAAASSARAAVTISVAPAIVYADSAVTISGSKDPASTVAVHLRPPGSTSIALSCSGTDAGSAAWSCAAPSGPRHFGSHQVQATETIDGVSSTATAKFEVVPDAVGGGVAPPPPPPPPPPTPTPTVTPTVTPTPTPTVTVPPGPGSTGNANPPANGGTSEADEQLETFALPEETPTPTVTPVPPAGPVAAGPQTPAAPRTTTASSVDPAAPTPLSEAVTTLQDIFRNPLTVAVAAGIGGLILLLVAIPANILDATIEANWDRIRAPFTRLIRFGDRVRKLTAKLPRFPFPAPLVIVLATVAFGFSSPEFGVDVTSLRMTLSLALGLILVVLIPAVITRIAMGRRWHVPAQIVARPGAFVLALLGVIASRTVGFSPGILVGLVLGLELARSARAEDRNRATTIRLVSTLGIALAAWIGYSVLTGLFGGAAPDVLGQLTLETLGAAASEGLAGVMVAILPVTFLEGRELFDDAKRRWVALAVPSAFAFALIVLPSVTTAEGPRQPIGLWIGVLVVFSILVAAVWLTFRIINRREERAAAADDAERSTEKQVEPAG